MGKTATSTTHICIDLSEPWEVSPHLLDALASFDQLVAQIDGATVGGPTHATLDLREAA